MSVPVSVIIHTLNEEINLPYALESVVGWADEVFVVDSCSHDATLQIAKSFDGVHTISRKCDRGGLVAQRNWALDELDFRNEWVFVLDADEILDSEIRREIESICRQNPADRDGYWCRFKVVFLGRWIPRASLYPTWTLRLFRHQKIRYEKRAVNSHPDINKGREGFLRGHLIHEERRGFTYYLSRIAEFAELEAKAYEENDDVVIQGRFFGSLAQRRRYLKNTYNRLPFRPAIMFVYLYFLRGGLFEGSAGFNYAFWKTVAEWATAVKRLEKKVVRLDDTCK